MKIWKRFIMKIAKIALVSPIFAVVLEREQLTVTELKVIVKHDPQELACYLLQYNGRFYKNLKTGFTSTSGWMKKSVVWKTLRKFRIF